MPQFRKKPVVIEARRVPVYDEYDNITDYLDDSIALGVWCQGVNHMMLQDDESGPHIALPDVKGPHIVIPTLEGHHAALPGDWIIKGVQGEFYPCKPDIFESTYERVDE